MTTLADLKFEDLTAGMKFRHAVHGEQIILDLGRGALGPAIRFHNSTIYDGEMPQPGEEDETTSVFELIAHKTFPYGAELWQYAGTAGAEELAALGLHWFEVGCPHCGFAHRFLAAEPSQGARPCRNCGMVFIRPAQVLSQTN